ncbi:MAG: hypothetical protein AcusKO_42130 [Acuticoccus sp.]
MSDVLAAGEGIETVLSVRQIMPQLPVVSALSAGHLAALQLPPELQRLYTLRDVDAAGDRAVTQLTARATASDIEAITLSPARTDFNEDLLTLGPNVMRHGLQPQLAPEDVMRFLTVEGPQISDA